MTGSNSKVTPCYDLIADFNALQVKSCPKTQTRAK